MLPFILMGGAAVLSAKGAISAFETVADYVIIKQEETEAITWRVSVLGKTVCIHTDEEYYAFDELFYQCNDVIRQTGDATNGQGPKLVLWCMLRWASCGDSMWGLIESTRKKSDDAAEMLERALMLLPDSAKQSALLVAPSIKMQGAIPPSYPL